jgi:predicted ArsR family transcriptional regulator
MPDMELPTGLELRIAAIAALDQPIRRDLYRLLSAADGWISRDEAATALGVARSVAAFHLDKLADAGVVEVRFERTSGRQGPGAGRPSKLYRPASDELAASVPARHYDLAGSLLASAVAESTRTGASAADCLRTAAHAAGRALGEEASEAVAAASRADARRQAVIDVLARHGYEPELGRRKEIILANCPFHRLAEEHRQLVCGMNLDFLAGVLEGMGSTVGLTARLEPEPGYCCVRIAA